MPKLGSSRQRCRSTKTVAAISPSTPVPDAPLANRIILSDPLAITPAEQALFNTLFGPLIERILAESD